MKKYEVNGIKRLREYKILLNILSQYHARQFNFKNEGKKEGGIIYFAIPKANSIEMEEKLKESDLVFKVLG